MKPVKYTDSYQLAKLLSKGDEPTFEYLFHSYKTKLFVYAFRFLKSNELADEIVQETFIKIWDIRQTIDPAGSLSGYLFTIARNLILDNFRKAASDQKFHDRLVLQALSFHNGVEEEIIYNELQEISQEAIRKMTVQQQQVFNLSRNNGLSYSEIARKLHISENTVKTHIHNSLIHLKKHLEAYSSLLFILFSL
jgi:RNA polymerase sigma-70 factor (family 1)